MVTRRGGNRIARDRLGRGLLGCLIPLLVITIMGYFAVHASDAAFRYYRFRDAMQQEARFAHRPRRTDDVIKQRLRAFADSQGLPIEARNVKVYRTETRIRISADYAETIDFPFFSKRIDFHPAAERIF
jgi:hypothetical protein